MGSAGKAAGDKAKIVASLAPHLWSRGQQSRDSDDLSLVSNFNSLEMEMPREKGGQQLAVGVIFVCAGLVSTLIIVLCIHFSPKRSRRVSRRAPREDYVDATSSLDLPPPNPLTAKTRAARTPVYELARPILDPHPPSPHHRAARLREYEEARPTLGPQLPTSRGLPHYYEETVIVSGASSSSACLPRERTDSAGYIVIPEVVHSPAAPVSSEYNRLGDDHLKRTMSDPTGPQKAYHHVMLGARSKSAGAKTSANGSADVRKDVTSPGHQYDVSSVAVTEPVRVEVIDGIYDKLDKTTV